MITYCRKEVAPDEKTDHRSSRRPDDHGFSVQRVRSVQEHISNSQEDGSNGKGGLW